MSDIPERLLPFCACAAKALSVSSRTWISRHLNPEMDSLSSTHSLLQDWRGVAEFLLFTALDIDNFARERNPTAELLRQWAFQDTSTIGKLLEAVEAVERFDVLNEEQLAKNLERDCTAYQKSIEAQMNDASRGDTQPIQVDEVTSVDEFKNITVNEVTTGVPEYFDAFVCYTSQDFDFVRQMMHKLETVHGLKLCIVSRDLMPGCAVYVIMAKLIQYRCRKMIIVLSPDYINSKECEFQTRFAHSLAPGAKEKKLIPVIYRSCAIPPILNHICTVDFTRCDVVEWFWVRLANSLKKTQRDDALMIPELSTMTTTLEHKLATGGSPGALGITHRNGTSQDQGFLTVTGISAAQALETATFSRNLSADSLTDTGSDKSWTDLSGPNLFQQEDEFMKSQEITHNPQALSESVEMPDTAPTNTKSKSKLLKKFFPFKKH